MNKFFLIVFAVLTLIFVLSRLTNLLAMPIFTDEAIYLWWAKIGLLDNSQRFISLTDGKQPLLIWMFTLAMKITPDPLLAGRLVSTLCGFFGFIGMFFAGREIFRSMRIGLWSAFFYLVSPFFLLYDRLALYDSLVAAFTVWSIYLIVLLVRFIRLDIALILGAVLGGGMLTKSNALSNILLLLPSVVLARYDFFTRKFFLKWLFFSGLAVAISLVMYNFLRLSPWFYIIARKNQEFIYYPLDWIKHPFQYFLPNLEGLTKWLLGYLTVPVAFVIFLGLLLPKAFWREKIFLFWAFLAPFIGLALFGKVLFPRFLLFMTVPLYLLAAWTVDYFLSITKNKIASLFLLLLLIQPLLLTDFKLIFDPKEANIPKSDRDQYFDDWPSGYGVNEVREYLRSEMDQNSIYVATEGTFGLFPAALELYFVGDPRIELRGYWPVNEDTINMLTNKAREKKTFIIFKETRVVPERWPLIPKLQVKRGKGSTYLRFYQVRPRGDF